MNYTETLDWMFLQLPMYQRQGKTAFKKDLTNSLALSAHLNYPEKKIKTVHVAGTNGKGSTSHIIASVLQQAGYKVGLYTSPHLKDFRERIRINGIPIEKKEVVRFIQKNQSFLENNKLSFFEMTVGMAFNYFANQLVDIAVVEVGLGGRLDSTNILTPEVSVITNIGFDHTQFLGNTLEEIAFEKAGIIKPNTPVVIGEYQEGIYPVFKNRAEQLHAKIYVAAKEVTETYQTDLKGNYQKNNVKTATKALEILRDKEFVIPELSFNEGMKQVVANTGLLGRWQQLNSQPKVICDTAHNTEGLTYVLEQLQKETFEELHIVLGVVNDKNLKTILPLFPKEAKYYFCKPAIPRGLAAVELQLQAAPFNLKGKIYNTVKEAYATALNNAKTSDLIYIGGSTFVVAEVV